MQKIVILASVLAIAAIAVMGVWFNTYTPQHNKLTQNQEINTQIDIPEEVIQVPLKTSNYSFTLGFTTLHKKAVNQALTIDGKIPAWLSGTLLRVGPGKFEMNTSHATHWLDGLSMAHRFTIKKGTVSYSNKLLKSYYYKNAKKTGILEAPSLNKGKSFFSRLSSALSTPKQLYDNVNVNIAHYDNQCVALTETPTPLAFDPNSLSTIKSLEFQDKLGGHFCCAHPRFDKKQKQWFNFFITYGNTSSYTIYTMPEHSLARKKLTSVSVKRPAYMHSFALTDRYIILTEPPFTLKPTDLLFGEKTFLEYFTWEPEKGSRFIVVDKNTGKSIGEYTTDAFFSLHHINAFDNHNTITLDIPTYKNNSIINAYFFDNICNHHQCYFPQSTLERFIIHLDTGRVERLTLAKHNIEMPRINSSCSGCNYRYVYGIHFKNTKNFANALIKVDNRTLSHHLWHEDACYPSEPIFVAKPHAKHEDEGVLLSVVLDAQKKHSFLLVLDAQTMQEVARASLDHHIPFTMHGQFYHS